MPNCLKSCLPWYSLRSIGARTLATWLTSLPMDAIVVNTLRKRYGEVQALDGVSFSVREGEVFGLLGPNGAGKSTTVRVLVTLTHPDEGTASVAGHDVRGAQNAVRRAIGYVPQDSGRRPVRHRPREPDAAGPRPGHERPRPARPHGELLELVGIADAADRIVKNYSGGMRRRLDIALGLVHRPRVLFLDEPTTGLDPEARVAMWSEVSRLAAGGVADDPADDALPRGGRPARRPARDRLAGKGGRRGHADRAEARAARRRGARRARERRGRGGAARARERRRAGRSRCSRGARSSRASRTAGVSCPGSSRRSRVRASASPRSRVSRPSLDDVYLHFTGRDFGAEDRG